LRSCADDRRRELGAQTRPFNGVVPRSDPIATSIGVGAGLEGFAPTLERVKLRPHPDDVPGEVSDAKRGELGRG
jgi:hypothetical protein